MSGSGYADIDTHTGEISDISRVLRKAAIGDHARMTCHRTVPYCEAEWAAAKRSAMVRLPSNRVNNPG